MAGKTGVSDNYAAIVRNAEIRLRRRQKAVTAARRSLARGAWTKLDTQARLVQRAERLGRWLAATFGRPDPLPDEALAYALLAKAEPARLTEAALDLALAAARDRAKTIRQDPDQLDDLTFERILGSSRDLLSIEFFEQGLQAALCVGLVSTDESENGTGFLVAPGVMITNWHVLENEERAASSDFTLDFANRIGPSKTAQIFRLEPERFFLASRELNYTLVAVVPS